MTFKNCVVNYFNTGPTSFDGVELNQQIFVANIICFSGLLITFVMGLYRLSRGDIVLSCILLGIFALFFITVRIIKYCTAEEAKGYVFNLIQIVLIPLMLYLVYSGGYINTGPLWIYLLPPVIFFFGGLRRGLISLAAFVLMTSLLLFYPNEQLLLTVYSDEFKSRLLYSFISICTLFAFYEYARQVSYKSLCRLMTELEEQAREDILSGLQNRRGMLEKISYEHKRVKRNNKHMTMMMCDVDNFKQVNDDFGHDTGDYIIKELARIFTDSIRETDVIGRWGGEEFLFMLPETSGQQAYVLAEKLRKMIAATIFTHQQQTLKLTVSIGIYEFGQGDTIDQAISSADSYLYQAKNQGRNTTVMTS